MSSCSRVTTNNCVCINKLKTLSCYLYIYLLFSSSSPTRTTFPVLYYPTTFDNVTCVTFGGKHNDDGKMELAKVNALILYCIQLDLANALYYFKNKNRII